MVLVGRTIRSVLTDLVPSPADGQSRFLFAVTYTPGCQLSIYLLTQYIVVVLPSLALFRLVNGLHPSYKVSSRFATARASGLLDQHCDIGKGVLPRRCSSKVSMVGALRFSMSELAPALRRQ